MSVGGRSHADTVKNYPNKEIMIISFLETKPLKSNSKSIHADNNYLENHGSGHT